MRRKSTQGSMERDGSVKQRRVHPRQRHGLDTRRGEGTSGRLDEKSPSTYLEEQSALLFERRLRFILSPREGAREGTLSRREPEKDRDSLITRSREEGSLRPQRGRLTRL